MNNGDFDQRQADGMIRAGTGKPEMRDGKSWEDFLARFRLRGITDSADGRWDVESASGGVYTVRRRAKMDQLGSYYNAWTCTCPARKRCRHIDAVEAMLAAELRAQEDWDSLNELIG